MSSVMPVLLNAHYIINGRKRISINAEEVADRGWESWLMLG
ncbi:MAG: hypothetical protein RXQ73_01780 [Caldivirga sp.]|jgi:flagellar basal body L-ring protein FlgH